MQISAALVKELRERTGSGMMECKKALVESAGDIEAAVEFLRKSGQANADKKSGRITAQGLIGIATDEDSRTGAMVEVNCETDFVAKEAKFVDFVTALARRVLAESPSGVDNLLALPIEPETALSVDERRRELVALIGENITVRRLCVLDSADGQLGHYSHGGRIGVLVGVHGGDAALVKDMAMHIAASWPLAVQEGHLPAGVVDKEREILRAQVADSGKPAEIQEKMVAGRLKKYLREVTLLGQPFVKDPDQSVEKYLRSAGAGVEGFARFEVGELAVGN